MEASNEMTLKEELLNLVEKSLENGETNKALDAIRNPKYSSCIETSSWDLIPNIVKSLSSSSKSISSGAQEILLTLVEHASPEEMLLELIEKAECAKEDASFLALLPAMQKTLSRLPEKRGRSLQWCLNTISQHLTAADESGNAEQSESEDENEKEDEEKVDKSAQRPATIYRSALEFCSPFIKEVALNSPSKSFDKPVLVQRDRQRRVLQTFLLQALGQIAANADLQINKDVKNSCRLLAEDIVHALCNVCSDVLFFLTYMIERSKTAQNLKAKDFDQTWEDINPFLYEDVVPVTGLGVLYYLVLVEGIRSEHAPCVYSNLFIFQTILHVVLGMISCSDNHAVLKGLNIAEVAQKRLGRPPLSADILDDPVQSKFCIALVQTVFRTGSVRTARLAVTVFKTYLKSFSQKGQYQILKNLHSAIPEQGCRGFLMTQLKDSIDRSLKEHSDEEGVELFRGTSLFNLITLLGNAPLGQLTVAEHADHIIATLNLMWYLVLCKDSEKLGLARYVESFEEAMEDLGEDLSMCRATYEQENMRLKRERENPSKHNQVMEISKEDKMRVVEATINKLVLIDTLLTDVDKAMKRWRSDD